jgi:hypothetical protein
MREHAEHKLAEIQKGIQSTLVSVYLLELVHRVISRRHTVGFKRVWMRGVSEEHIRCDT